MGGEGSVPCHGRIGGRSGERPMPFSRRRRSHRVKRHLRHTRQRRKNPHKLFRKALSSPKNLPFHDFLQLAVREDRRGHPSDRHRAEEGPPHPRQCRRRRALRWIARLVGSCAIGPGIAAILRFAPGSSPALALSRRTRHRQAARRSGRCRQPGARLSPWQSAQGAEPHRHRLQDRGDRAVIPPSARRVGGSFPSPGRDPRRSAAPRCGPSP